MHVLGVPWLQLPGQQNVLVQVLFTESDYSIRVTDLKTIWGEDLSPRGIKARAETVDCPIDAEVNLEDLLKRLQNALTVDSRSTSIILRRRKEELKLSTCEKIGGTLLEWEFCLTALPYSAVANGLTLSLFAMVSFYQTQISSLHELIQDKDNVIRNMDELCKRSNIRFKPNRRQHAFFPFNKKKWLETSRSKAESDAKGAQEVIDELSLVGREAEFRNDWRAVLTKVPFWEVSFLPDTTERTPTKVTSTTKKSATSTLKHNSFEKIGPPSKLIKEDTEAQTEDFITLEAIKKREKKKIHTKCSSPFHSEADYNDREDDDDDDDANNEITPRGLQMTSAHRTSSPTPSNMKEGNQLSSPPPIYKIRDNRESQTLEPDIDLYSDIPVPSSDPPSSQPVAARDIPSEGIDSGDETMDESEEDDLPAPSARRKASESAHLKKGLDSSNHDTIQYTSSGVEDTPRRSRVKNVISPRKPRQETTAAESAAPPSSPPKLDKAETRTSESQVIDLESKRRERARQKRKEVERIVKQSPAKKKVRRF